MVKQLFLGFFCTFLFYNGWSQPDQKKSPQPSKILLNVLFATNEDCDIYINDELKGAVLKDELRYIQLSPGRYSLSAKTKTTLDVLNDSFSVAEGKLNEVFMDMLYVVDEKAAERERLKKERELTVIPVSSTDIVDQNGVNKLLTKKDAEKAVINSLTGNLVKIKTGSFTMGNNKAPFPDEIEHPVTISAFLFSKYEVTQHQWETIMGYNPSFNKGCATCPVENVSWEEVMRFIRKLNIISNKKFRLPTEAEWEYVAKLGGKAEIEKAGGQEEYIKKTAWYFSNSNKVAHSVGLKQPNASGIFDMTGNVSEWCADWYGTYYYKEDYNQLNPEGPPLGKEKVIRGGNFKESVGDRFRPSIRNKRNPTEKRAEVGFRLVMDLNE